MLTALLCLVVAQPQLPPLPQAPPLEARVTALEQRVAALERNRPRAAAASQPTVIPPGYHAHRTADGRTIVHADSNVGNAAAHAGVAYPWPKTAVAGQVVYGATVQSSCPGGNCPAPQRRFLFRR